MMNAVLFMNTGSMIVVHCIDSVSHVVWAASKIARTASKIARAFITQE